MAEGTERDLSPSGLTETERALLRGVFRGRPDVTAVKYTAPAHGGTARPNSDIDLAVFGHVSRLECRRIRHELGELPLPYRFDVTPYALLEDAELKRHIDEDGLLLYVANE